MNRAIIIGNSGSGKTYLASRLGTHLSLPVTHLDDVYWEPGGLSRQRPETMVYQDIEKIMQTQQWIVEGVFGELAVHFLNSADSLIWLDMDWAYCHRNLLARGSESHKQVDKDAAQVSFQRLLAWASHYWDREDARSHAGHKQIYDHFQQRKWVLRSRKEVNYLIAALTPDS